MRIKYPNRSKYLSLKRKCAQVGEVLSTATTVDAVKAYTVLQKQETKTRDVYNKANVLWDRADATREQAAAYWNSLTALNKYVVEWAKLRGLTSVLEVQGFDAKEPTELSENLQVLLAGESKTLANFVKATVDETVREEKAAAKAEAEFGVLVNALDPELSQLQVALTLAELALKQANLKLPKPKKKTVGSGDVKPVKKADEVKNDSTPPV
jgi:hypothetical protein